jgi:hypothetical protein
VINHLTGCRIDSQIAVDSVVVEGADTSGLEAHRFGGEIQTVADSAGFEVGKPVAALPELRCGAVQASDHRKGDACVSGEVLTQAQAGGRDSLVAGPKAFAMEKDAGIEVLYAVDKGVQANEAVTVRGGGIQQGLELLARDGAAASGEVERRAPLAGNLAEGLVVVTVH